MNSKEAHDKFLADKKKGDIGEEYIIQRFTGKRMKAYPSHEKGFDYRYSDIAVYYDDTFISLIEVKSEQHQWEETGNHYLEYQYKGRRSGIASTEANLWALLLFKKNGEIKDIILPVKKVKELAREYINTDRDVAGGDNNDTKGILLPIAKLEKLQKKYGINRK